MKPQPSRAGAPYDRLAPFDDDGRLLQVVVETARGGRNKYKYDEARGLFVLRKVLPIGMSFPFDFGFVPGTRGDDGDPLDVLVLMDEGSFAGCVVAARLLGVVEVEQTAKGKSERNDRLLAVADVAPTWKSWAELDDVDDELLREVDRFLVGYVDPRKKTVRILGHRGAAHARKIVERATIRGEP